MADRVSVSITIGGDLAASMRDQLVDLITDEGLSTEWDGPAFDAAQFPDDAPLMLYAHEVAWGRLDGLKRSEEHTSELQSLMRISYAVFCLKKKNKHQKHNNITNSNTEHKTTHTSQ